MWLRQAGLPQRHQDDLRLQVHGDLSRFNDLRTLAVRLSHRVEKGNSTGDVFYEQADHNDYEDTSWYADEIYWSEPWWDEDTYLYDTDQHDETWYGDEEYFDPFEQWPGDPSAEPGYQGEDRPGDEEPDGVYSSGGGRGRGHGKGAFGTGCHVCGSKWHRAADCPVRGKGFDNDGTKGKSGKGKYSKGRPKGKGKGKGYPKGKMSGKGRGKGWSKKGSWSSPDGPRSWLPRYYTNNDLYGQDEDYMETYQMRHARTGLQLGESTPRPPSSQSTKYFSMERDAEVKNDYFEDLLKLERSTRTLDQPSASQDPVDMDQGSSVPSAPTAKNLIFFVRKISGEESDEEASPRHQTYHEQPDHGDVYHTVSGQRRRGLIIDPGAANGLIGSETLRDLLAHVDKARQVKDTLEWKPKRAEVTGISGAADTTLGEITMKLPMLNDLDGAHYKADVIGGEASMCPALVGNPALVNMKSILAANWFANKDGLLAIPTSDGNFHLIRLLYTDSRHYLLPLDEECSAKESIEEANKFKGFLTKIHTTSCNKWSDVRTWFTRATTAKPKRSQSNLEKSPTEATICTTTGPGDDGDGQQPPTATVAAPHEIKKDTGAVIVGYSDDQQPPTATSAPQEIKKDTGANVFIEEQLTSISGSPISEQLTSISGPSSAETKFSMPTCYYGDSLPQTIDERPRRSLASYYKHNKEEYCVRTGHHVVTPGNLEQWKTTSRATRKAHLWEIGLGAGRLSYLAVLAGLATLFPVDYRYGWDITNHDHQQMLLAVQRETQPSVIVISPMEVFPKLTMNATEEERESLRQKEIETMNFVKTMAAFQAHNDKGFVVEGPWSSPRWKRTCLSTLEHDVPGCRPKQRSDACAYGLASASGQPVARTLGIQGNFSSRASTHRCRGHPNGHFTGQGTADQGLPHQLCRSLVKDIKKFIGHSEKEKFIGYKCPKCKLGRNAPPGTERTMVPRECRHASSLPTPAASEPASSSQQPPVLQPQPSARSAVTTPMPQLIEEFRQRAMKKPNLDEMKVQMPGDMKLSAIDMVTLKSLLTELLNDSINIVAEQKGKHNHWSQDPLHLAILRKIFAKYMTDKGVSTSLHAEVLPLPMPFLRTETAPLRMIIRGEVRAWTIKPIEDLRTYSDKQLKEKKYHEDWIIAIFGSSPQDRDYWELDKARGRATRHHLQPRVAMFTPREDEGPISLDELTSGRVTIAQPYDSPGPKVIIRDEWTSRESSRAALEQGRWTGTTEFTLRVPEDDPAPPDDPVVRAADVRGDELDAEEIRESAQEAEAEGAEGEATIDPPRRTNFDFRRVLVRLPRLARTDEEQAKRLILGLHERFWHANASDLKSLLSRAGMPSEVLKLVAETVSGCAICRRYSKLKSKPVVKAGHPGAFNVEVQADYFQLWEQWFLILVDVATRYKVITKVSGRDLPTALQTILQNWLRFFGPMKKLISDQESCLMSHEAAAEFERMNIERAPAGTTRGRAQGEHTTTGVVEKHTDLSKICMLKLKAECQRQGLDADPGDIAAEASFAQNATINIGGYSPHMMGMGTLPMPYYDMDAPGIQAFTGADQVNPTIYERALRLRQLALTAAAQAIAEDRIARAGHTRPQRLPTEDMKPGVTEIEFHREDADGLGWRGPGLLLKLQDNGSAIVEYQGRPYLIPMRSLRVFRGAYYANMHTTEDKRRERELESWMALRRLMDSVEACVPHRIDTFGHLKNNRGKWTTLPRTMGEEQRSKLLEDIALAARFLTDKPCHGIRVGTGLRKMVTFAGTTGTLVAWMRNTVRMSIVDNPSGNDMSTAAVRMSGKESMCYLYFYSYDPDFVELPASTWAPRGLPMEESPIVPTTPTPDLPQQAPDSDAQPMETVAEDHKRSGPETRTVVLGPESKKQRVSFLEAKSTYMHEVFLNMHRRQHVVDINDADPSYGDVDSDEVATPTVDGIFHMKSSGWYADVNEGCIFRVDTATDNIEEHQVADIWPQVEEADYKEVGQFVTENAFRAVRRDELGSDCAIIDAIWVRKWKKAPSGRIVKSRLCVRGCHDPWKHELSSRSSTATRLSQRIILVSATNGAGKTLESWDIAGAFLKGLTYQELWKALKELGVQCVERMIAIIPPRNVWRHLKKLSPKFNIREEDIDKFVLLCLKPVYGLSEAPLAWQLYLHKYLKQLGGQQSHFDECFWYWPSPRHGQWPSSSISTHVDDLAVEGLPKWHNEVFDMMVKKFGKLSRQTLPFMHCGCRYSTTADGIMVDQREYVTMLKPIAVKKDDKDDRDLSPSELTTLRSAIGALMWTGITRPDLLADLSTLQGVMNRAKVKHLKDANDLVMRAQRDKEAAIYYKNLHARHYRISCIHDASAASSTKNYAQEGVIVVLMADHLDVSANHVVADDEFAERRLSGRAQLLHMQSNKAKRVSYSTSHGETLAAINGLECATLVSTRLAEVTYGGGKPTINQLLAIQERGCSYFLVDTYTDARDFWELSTGQKSLPQDKSQRLYILAHREARASGRIRWVILTPTECMTADALTKPMQSACLMHWLTTGCIKFWNTGHPLELKRLPPSATFTEDDLIAGDKALETKQAWFYGLPMLMPLNKLCCTAVVLSLLPGAVAQPSLPTTEFRLEPHDLLLIFLTVMISTTSAALAVCCDRMFVRSSSSTTTGPTTTTPTTSSSTSTTGTSSTTTTSTASHDMPENFTVYIRPKGHSYHTPQCIYGQGGKKLLPCGFCNPHRRG